MKRKLIVALSTLLLVAALGAAPSRHKVQAQAYIPLIDICDICFVQSQEVYYSWRSFCQSTYGSAWDCEYEAQTAQLYYIATSCDPRCWC